MESTSHGCGKPIKSPNACMLWVCKLHGLVARAFPIFPMTGLTCGVPDCNVHLAARADLPAKEPNLLNSCHCRLKGGHAACGQVWADRHITPAAHAANMRGPLGNI